METTTNQAATQQPATAPATRLPRNPALALTPPPSIRDIAAVAEGTARDAARAFLTNAAIPHGARIEVCHRAAAGLRAIAARLTDEARDLRARRHVELDASRAAALGNAIAHKTGAALHANLVANFLTEHAIDAGIAGPDADVEAVLRGAA